MESLKDWLLKQRLENYGYELRDFRHMQRVKSKYRDRIMNMPDADIHRTLAMSGILGRGRRLSVARSRKTREKYWDYTTGQSFNEELVNMMVLSGSKGKKSFWEIQEKRWR